MSRRAQAPSRTILPDPKFNSEMLAKFMNVVMQSGKKSAAEQILYGALDRIAEKTGKLMPKDTKARMQVLEWLMFQMASVGPNFGQVHHFVKFNPGKAPYAEQRFLAEAKRLYGVMDKRLGEAACLAGDYSIADIACYPWIFRHEWQTIELAEFPNVKRWFEAIGARPAVQRGMKIPA